MSATGRAPRRGVLYLEFLLQLRAPSARGAEAEIGPVPAKCPQIRPDRTPQPAPESVPGPTTVLGVGRCCTPVSEAPSATAGGTPTPESLRTEARRARYGY